MTTPPAPPPLSKSILVVGAGWTGRQIAAQAAGHGLAAYLVDVDDRTTQEAVTWGINHIQTQRDEGVWRCDSTTSQGFMQGLTMSDWAATQVDFIVECTPEQLSLKRKVLRQLSEAAPAETILTSNSSYFVPSWLSKRIRFPERFAHWHFHVPVWIATVVDIVPCQQTDPRVIAELQALSTHIGQTPIVQTKEHPGYLFNWMLQSVITSALQLVARGISQPPEVDLAWQKVTQMPLGPFGIMDQIGLDVVFDTLQNASWFPEAAETESLIHLLRPLVEAGHLGVKTGQGFYHYAKEKTPTLVAKQSNRDT